MRPSLAFGVNILQQVANFFKRYPWIAITVSNLWRLGRPRFTAGVIGVVVNANKEVLIVEHVFHPKTPWGLPGGWVDRFENLERSLIRELEEELQLTAIIDQVLLVEISPNYPNHIDIAYLCIPQSDIGKLSSELLSYRWVTNLEELQSIPKFHYLAIKRALELRS